MAKFVFSAFADEAGFTLEEQIAALKRNDIGFMEVRAINGKNVLGHTEEELRAFRKQLDEAGIRVSSIGSPIGKYAIEKDALPHYEQFLHCLKAAEIFGTNKIRLFSFFVKQDVLKENRDEVIARMQKMLDAARERGILLCHENESEIYGQMPAEVKDLLTTLPELRGIFDAANFIMNDADVKEGFEATLPSLEYIHVKDACYADHAIVPAGEGDGKWSEMLLAANEARDGVVYLTLEPHLRLFDAFKDIDSHSELKGHHKFETATEAFDYAVKALENLLTSLGFKKGENREWKK
ncbi:MAG: sugar phosphate isomerase/epimerase [Clostridia bacterium]|nr:sugar phosphate isomerase/epimerase [Clostridia bacterium]MBO7170231.1 sugar phosphate isomerase/epimerase [Clostridia bacterium]